MSIGASYEQWAEMNQVAAQCIHDMRRLGIDTGEDSNVCRIFTAVRSQAKQPRLGFYDSRHDTFRAFDAARRTRSRDVDHPDLLPNPADECRTDDAEGGDLDSVLDSLRAIADGNDGSSEDRQCAAQLADALQSYLNRANDDDALRGRSMKDQERDGRAPWAAYEPGVTREGRDRLRRDRHLAARATDRKAEPGRSFLSTPALAGSDLANLEEQARATFNL